MAIRTILATLEMVKMLLFIADVRLNWNRHVINASMATGAMSALKIRMTKIRLGQSEQKLLACVIGVADPHVAT